MKKVHDADIIGKMCAFTEGKQYSIEIEDTNVCEDVFKVYNVFTYSATKPFVVLDVEDADRKHIFMKILCFDSRIGMLYASWKSIDFAKNILIYQKTNDKIKV